MDALQLNSYCCGTTSCAGWPQEGIGASMYIKVYLNRGLATELSRCVSCRVPKY